MSHATVMGQFRLTGFAALQVEATDTRGVVGWRRGAVVCAFRGTSTMSNVLSDVKTWMTRWRLQPGAAAGDGATGDGAADGGATGVRVHAGARRGRMRPVAVPRGRTHWLASHTNQHSSSAIPSQLACPSPSHPMPAGFYQAYLAGGFRDQLLAAVAAAVAEQPPGEPLQLYFAGEALAPCRSARAAATSCRRRAGWLAGSLRGGRPALQSTASTVGRD